MIGGRERLERAEGRDQSPQQGGTQEQKTKHDLINIWEGPFLMQGCDVALNKLLLVLNTG